MEVVANLALLLAVIVALNGCLRFLFGAMRRSRVLRWVEAQGLHVLDLRLSYRSWVYRSAVPYRLRVRDPGGHESEGTAWATGVLLRQVWVDWD
jgi:hypothetical protein